MIALSKVSFVDKILERFAMTDSKKGLQHFVSRFHFFLWRIVLRQWKKENNEKDFLRFSSRKLHACYVMHTSRYLLCNKDDMSISSESWSKTLTSS